MDFAMQAQAGGTGICDICKNKHTAYVQYALIPTYSTYPGTPGGVNTRIDVGNICSRDGGSISFQREGKRAT